MASRALAESQSSHFQAVNLTESGSYNRLVSTTTALWEQGLNLQFWPHHKSQTKDCTPLILPPYQFEGQQHWMPLKYSTSLTNMPDTQKPNLTRRLTRFLGYQDADKSSLRFGINTKQERFRELVAATLVVGTACIPSSMLQLEVVRDAFNSLQSNTQTLPLDPEIRNVKHHCTFLVDDKKQLYLDTVKRSGNDLEWDWKICSGDRVGYTSGILASHVGKLSRHLEGFELLQRVVNVERCSELLNDPDTEEVVQGQSIYRAFEPIVAWGSPYRHVAQLCAKDMETAGLVKRAFDGEQLMNPTLSECFCQVASLHVSLMEKTADAVFICSEISRWYRAPRVTLSAEM